MLSTTEVPKQREILKNLKSDSFRYINNLNFLDTYGDPINHKHLDASIDKLQIKCKSLKQEWSKFIDRIKNGSRLALDKKTRWFKLLNLDFAEVNDAINLF